MNRLSSALTFGFVGTFYIGKIIVLNRNKVAREMNDLPTVRKGEGHIPYWPNLIETVTQRRTHHIQSSAEYNTDASRHS